MRHKPWPVIILALLHIFAPLGNIIFNSFISNMSIVNYMGTFFNSGNWTRALVVILVPILGGVLIYLCRKWSYLLYIVLMASPLVYNYLSWRLQPTAEFSFYLTLFSILNLLAVGYFLLPQVRQIYFDPRLRWWETKPRFKTEFEAQLTWGDKNAKGEIKNISEGGLFINTDLKVDANGLVQINFEHEKKSYSFKGEVVYSSPSDAKQGYGIKLTRGENDLNSLNELIKSLNMSGAIITSRVPTMEDSFSYWLKRLISQRKGLVPETAASVKKQE